MILLNLLVLHVFTYFHIFWFHLFIDDWLFVFVDLVIFFIHVSVDSISLFFIYLCQCILLVYFMQVSNVCLYYLFTSSFIYFLKLCIVFIVCLCSSCVLSRCVPFSLLFCPFIELVPCVVSFQFMNVVIYNWCYFIQLRIYLICFSALLLAWNLICNTMPLCPCSRVYVLDVLIIHVFMHFWCLFVFCFMYIICGYTYIFKYLYLCAVCMCFSIYSNALAILFCIFAQTKIT